LEFPVDDKDNTAVHTSYPTSLVPALKRSPNRHVAPVHVDKTALRELGFYPPADQERLIAAQYRQIKRPLVVNSKGGGATIGPNTKVIMVASALPGEGKTFTSINLSMSLAQEKDIDVLLADADLTSPRLSAVFGADKHPGLLECLEDETIDPESLVLPTDVPGLSFLPAGNPCDNATELLASVRMQKVLGQLNRTSARRIVVLDSSPLLATTESRVLASLVGQVVLVVRAGYTPQRAVLEAISQLGGDSWIGLILNQSESNRNRQDGYGYGYGSDKGERNAGKSQPL
jgi:exopolysaccharide/PEP-CTERM locus tyrosine autokinase